MNDQQRPTPQPFDDGPRSAVDPLLLPPTQPRQKSEPARETGSESTAEHADETSAERVESQRAADEPAVDQPAFDRPASDRPQTPVDVPDEPAPVDPAAASVTSAQSVDQDAPAAPFAVGADGGATRVDAEAVADTDDSTTSAPVPNATAIGENSPQRSRLDEAVQRSRSLPLDESVVATGTRPKPQAERGEQPTADEAIERDEHDDNPEAQYPEVDPETQDAPVSGGATRVTAVDDADGDQDRDGARDRDDAAFTAALLEEGATTEGLIVPPTKRGNRAFALLFAVIATLLFGALYLFGFAFMRMINFPETELLANATGFLGTAPFYLPVALFGIVMIVWSVLTNRGGWWSYILGGLFLAVLAFAGYYAGVVLQESFGGGALTVSAFLDVLTQGWHLPGALIAAIAARESATWMGGIIAARGRRLAKKNAAERAEYDRLVAEERDAAAINVEPSDRHVGSRA